MIELGVHPVDGAVAALALGSVTPHVHVVVHVTSVTVRRNAVKDLILMAIATRGRNVPTGQRESGRVMVEPRLLPVELVVTILAGSPHLALVNVLVPMAARARAGSSRPLGPGLMAVGAQGHVVCSAQLKIRPGVVEYRKVQPHDVRIPPLVIRMTGDALVVARIGMATM